MDEKTIVANCVITDAYDRIFLLHRSDSLDTRWELPSVTVGEEELPESAAIRAVSETLGVSARLTKSLGTGEYEDEIDDYIVYWFSARLIGDEPDTINDGEYDDFAYFDLEDMMSLALSVSSQLLMDKLYNGDVALGGE
ncbi:MAG TPA: NUDIX hydrolase [Candidatus Saccharimonadales bacterium]|jgi:ADP-ribose pyrophosphatase YjhB (NUDIX family)